MFSGNEPLDSRLMFKDAIVIFQVVIAEPRFYADIGSTWFRPEAEVWHSTGMYGYSASGTAVADRNHIGIYTQ